MSPKLTTFLFEAANFLVLAAVLGRVFFHPVRQALAEYRQRLTSETQAASERLAEAQQLQTEVQDERAHLQAELRDLRTRELETVRHQADQLLQDARATIERERDLHRREAARVSETQQDALADAAAAAAGQMVGRLLQQIAGPDLDRALLQSACQQLQQLPADGLAPVKIESSRPLAADELSALRGALRLEGGDVQSQVNPHLQGGVRISTGRGLVDASVAGLARFAGESLIQEMNRRANNHNPLQAMHDV